MFTRMILSLSLSISVLSLVIAGAFTADPNLPVFTYSGSSGPPFWGSLCEEYKKCSSGEVQSPVNIYKDDVVSNTSLKPLTRYYNPTANATLVNNCYHVGIRYEEDAGVLNVDGKNYTLQKMHWHSPSEHQIDGVPYPAELHLVHKANDGNFSVVAILYKYTDDNEPDPLLFQIKDQVGALPHVKCGSPEAQISLGNLDLTELRNQTTKYYRYAGSLTTPPCSEKIIWTILRKVRNISKEQVAALKAPMDSLHKNNSRPCQPLGNRKIELYEHDDDDNDHDDDDDDDDDNDDDDDDHDDDDDNDDDDDDHDDDNDDDDDDDDDGDDDEDHDDDDDHDHGDDDNDD